MLKSFFITGTDTDVGKTYVAAGIASALRKKGIDVGIMKPFAAGVQQKVGFKSKDTEILAQAAEVKDPETLVNPQFFPIPASPFTASQNLGIKVDLELVLNSFKELSESHQMMLVEGMGGIMTPILKDYFITNLIKDLNLETIIVTRSKVGTVNHTIMTFNSCVQFGLNVAGIIINDFDSDGYPPEELKRDLETITSAKILGIIPRIENFKIETLRTAVEQQVDIQYLSE